MESTSQKFAQVLPSNLEIGKDTFAWKNQKIKGLSKNYYR